MKQRYVHMSLCNNRQDTPATHCNTLQHTATHCNTLQHTATHCYTVQHTLFNTLQHTATHCNTLQHTATHCSTCGRHVPRHRNTEHCNNPCIEIHNLIKTRNSATPCNTLKHTATHYTMLHHTVPHCNTLQHTATHSNTDIALQSRGPTCNTVQQTAATHSHCNKSAIQRWFRSSKSCQAAIHCNTLLQHTATQSCHTATRCNTLQHTATRCNALYHTVTHWNNSCMTSLTSFVNVVFRSRERMQRTATHCSTLQHTATTAATHQWHRSSTSCTEIESVCSTLQHAATQCNKSCNTSLTSLVNVVFRSRERMRAACSADAVRCARTRGARRATHQRWRALFNMHMYILYYIPCYIYMYTLYIRIHMYICLCMKCDSKTLASPLMGWIRLVGSIKL